MTARRNRPFLLEALVDFPDDAQAAELTPAALDAMMQTMRRLGVRRLSWAVYADGRGGFMIPAHSPKYRNMALTYCGLGQDPLKAAVTAAHRHGLEIYAYFKPYETGPALLFPAGTPEAAIYGRLDHIGGRLSWLDPFVVDNPQLRIKRRDDDLLPAVQLAPVSTLKLRKADAAPTRVQRQNLQLWTSDLNYRYQRLEIPFEMTEGIEPCREDVYDLQGECVARRGDAQRVLTLSGFELTAPFILVTTDFADGPADFRNTDLALLSAFAADGREILGETASKAAIWLADQVDFRNWGLVFDTGYNGARMALDEANSDNRSGIVAFARGRNRYLPGALCETEPEVQRFWLQYVEVLLDHGVDGIDIREESHSTHTNHPEDYGYNAAVLDACRARGAADRQIIATVRGEAYTEFLRQAKQRINRRGKSMRINFQLDWYRDHPPRNRRLAYPANLDFQWQRWLEEGLTDEAVLRFFRLPFDCIYEDAVAEEFIARCQAGKTPVTVNRYIPGAAGQLKTELARIHDDPRFTGFILYETAKFLQFDESAACTCNDAVAEACERLAAD